VERARPGRGEEPFELAPPGTALQSASDEELHVLVGNSEAVQFGEHGGKRGRPWIELGLRDRQRGRLDHDRHPATAPNDAVERFARERERQRVANGGSRVDHAPRRGRWPQDDVPVPERDADDPRARDERHAAHSLSRRVDTVAG
jgi:hypothetical protein